MAHIKGTPGNDRLIGTIFQDTIEGGGGDDYIKGDQSGKFQTLGAADLIFGGDGNDRISAGYGDDTVNGGNGNDHVFGFNGDDILSGGGGNDEVLGGRGDDLLFSGDGNDTVEGWQGNDWLFAESGFNELTGGEGNDAFVALQPVGETDNIVLINDFEEGEILYIQGSSNDFSLGYADVNGSGSADTFIYNNDGMVIYALDNILDQTDVEFFI